MHFKYLSKQNRANVNVCVCVCVCAPLTRPVRWGIHTAVRWGTLHQGTSHRSAQKESQSEF